MSRARPGPVHALIEPGELRATAGILDNWRSKSDTGSSVSAQLSFREHSLRKLEKLHSEHATGDETVQHQRSIPTLTPWRRHRPH
jgi:hypothetical protein